MHFPPPPSAPLQAPSGYMPHLQKLWKSYVFQSGVVTRSVSPFEVNVLGSLFKDIGHKVKHRITDNFLDVAPGLAAGVGVVVFAKSARASYLHSHRS